MGNLGEEPVWGGNELSVGFDECEGLLDIYGDSSLLLGMSGPHKLMGKADVSPKCWKPLEVQRDEGSPRGS